MRLGKLICELSLVKFDIVCLKLVDESPTLEKQLARYQEYQNQKTEKANKLFCILTFNSFWLNMSVHKLICYFDCVSDQQPKTN